MELVTKKSACKIVTTNTLVKSPKEAIRGSVKNNNSKGRLVVKLFPSAFVASNGKHDSLWG